MNAMHDVFFAVPQNSTLTSLESYGTGFAEWQRGVMWWIGDLARYVEARYPDTWQQVFPDWVSPGMIDRAKAVAKAYPREADRNPLATWAIHMQNANRPDRIRRVQDHVDAGRTTDEARKADQRERAESSKQRWLLAVDVNYFLHRFWFSGAGVEAATSVASWVQRTVGRLKEKGLTDVACCFDAETNHRKTLTAEWEDKYKDRPPKDVELIQQLQVVRDLLEHYGFSCVSVAGMEADDCMASYADQFKGRVTLLSQDKDVRQCLSERCNILLDVEWTEDPTSGDAMPQYKWFTATPTARLSELRSMLERVLRCDGGDHTRTELQSIARELDVSIRGLEWDIARDTLVTKLDALIALEPANLLDATGLHPLQWADYQCLMGDSVDGVKGAAGIGEKGAADLIKQFGRVDTVIEAAKAGDERIPPKKRQSLIEFEAKSAITRRLVTLLPDLVVPQNTRI